jgi:hypothetical protein
MRRKAQEATTLVLPLATCFAPQPEELDLSRRKLTSNLSEHEKRLMNEAKQKAFA